MRQDATGGDVIPKWHEPCPKSGQRPQGLIRQGRPMGEGAHPLAGEAEARPSLDYCGIALGLH